MSMSVVDREAVMMDMSAPARVVESAGDDLLFASQRAIGDGVTGSMVLDIHPGSSTTLGTWVRGLGGRYIALDTEQKNLDSHRIAGHAACWAGLRSDESSTEDLPFEPGSMNIVHCRSVLCSFTSVRRGRLIKEMAEIARERLVMIEADWNTFDGSELVQQFVAIANRFYKNRKDLFLGKSLEKQVKSVLDGKVPNIVSRSFAPAQTSDYNHLVLLCNRIEAQIPRASSDYHRIREVGRALLLESMNAKRELYTLPQLFLVEVHKR